MGRFALEGQNEYFIRIRAGGNLIKAVQLAPRRARSPLLILGAGTSPKAGSSRLDPAPLKNPADIAPALAEARLKQAESRVLAGDILGAIQIAEALAAEAPQFWWVWEKLAELKVRVGNFPDAAFHFREASLRKPGDPTLIYKWARATFDADRPEEAKVILADAARLAPGHEAILHLYADIYARSGDWHNLLRIAQSWVRSHPQNPLPWRHAATAQWETGYLTQAMQSYRTFLDRGGRNAVNLATYGRLCMTALAYEEATRALDEAERLDPDCAHMLSAKATLSMFRGQFPDAIAFARRAVSVEPQDTAAYKVLVQVSNGQVTEDERAHLEQLTENRDLPLPNRIAASFALADCLDAESNAEVAFAAYERANRLSAERAAREGLAYDRALRRRQVDEVISRFPSVPRAATDDAAPVPIFIVGMPRSGTTLVESVLGAHSGVLACGERQAMRSVMQEFMAMVPPVDIDRVPETTRERWRADFLRDIPDTDGAIAVTDKNPWNFDALGMILGLFPNARVIHVLRDPVETGLSIFRNEFPKFASFTCQLTDIGHYYGEYARLMAHWSAVLKDRFITVRYEDLVADFERVAPQMVQFCGLAWEDACRDFSSGNRVIATMSAAQARRPLSGFKGRSERYAPFLSPLISALREAGVDLRTGACAPDASPSRAGDPG